MKTCRHTTRFKVASRLDGIESAYRKLLEEPQPRLQESSRRDAGADHTKAGGAGGGESLLRRITGALGWKAVRCDISKVHPMAES
jgi:hypothetical protein